MTNVLIIGAVGQIPAILIPRLQAEPTLKLPLFGSDAANLPYDNVTKVSGDASRIDDLIEVMQNQDTVYMNFDNLAITKLVIEAMHETGVKRIIQAGVLGVYGEVAEPFAPWNARMTGGVVAANRGNEALEASDLDYTYADDLVV